MASPLHFRWLEFSLGGGSEEMKLRISLAGLAIALLLGGTAILPSKTSAQDSSVETGKRKVRTRVVPEYPQLARQMNVTGKVKIQATIAADGHVLGTKVVGGSPLLVNAALEALKKWHYEPGPKQTTELVEFEFSGQQ
jgi:TonB family protein